MQNEIWVSVLGYEGVYEASSLGRVRSLDRYVAGNNGGRVWRTGKVLLGTPDKDGYLRVCLSNKGKSKQHGLHRVIATAFVPGDFTLVVNHKDGVKTNNPPSNLEWVTTQYNTKHACDIGLRPMVLESIKTQAVALRAKGFTDLQVRTALGLSKGSMHRATKNANTRVSGRIPKDKIEAVRLQRWATGDTYLKIARTHGIHQSAVCRYCKGIQVNEMVSA